MKKLFLVIAVVFAVSAGCYSADLLTYVQKPDNSFKWEKSSESESGLSKSYVLRMTSQTWQGITWTHNIEIFLPAKCDYPKTAFMWITSGKPGDEQSMLFSVLAANMGCPVAILRGIPNQPLFDGLKEDALIAYTFSKTMETKDMEWPLLLPMTKSAVRAMDAIQDFARSDLKQEITGFVVSGGSKRGWTTWLTAAADPVRVKAIIPAVYDNLNLPLQMPHQLATWGEYSEMIHDYTERGLQQVLASEEGKQLSELVDPWTYRDRITMPKLIVNGTNDPYWTQDALNLYWDGIRERKFILYVPNGGHGLGDIARPLLAMTAFTRAVASDGQLPKIAWKHTTSKDSHKLEITTGSDVKTANLWVAKSDTLDFRKSRWESTPMERTETGFSAQVPVPTTGHTAVFGEVNVPMSDRTCNLSTQIAILNPSSAE